MSSPLVDPEGFPRADIDVYTVRHARAAIVRLRNDHRAVVEEMGRVLQVVYAAREGEGPAIVVERSAVAVQPSGVNGTGRIQTALAKVNAVAPGSPAAQAVRLPFSSVAVYPEFHTSGNGEERPHPRIRASRRGQFVGGCRSASSILRRGMYPPPIDFIISKLMGA